MKTITNLAGIAICIGIIVTTAAPLEAQQARSGIWQNDLQTLILPGTAGNGYVCKVLPHLYPHYDGEVSSIDLELWSGPHCTGDGIGIGWICGEGGEADIDYCDEDNRFSQKAIESYAKMLRRAEANGTRVRYYLSSEDGTTSDFTIRYMQFHAVTP